MSAEHIHRNDKGHVLAEKSEAVEYLPCGSLHSLTMLEYLFVGGGLVSGPVPDIGPPEESDERAR